MRFRKGVLLFEVTLVALLVAIISVFLFKGYHVFLKSGRRCLDYLRMVLLSDEKMWDLQGKEKIGDSSLYTERQGNYDSLPYYWSLDIENEENNANLTKGILKISSRGKRELSFDTIMYFNKLGNTTLTQE